MKPTIPLLAIALSLGSCGKKPSTSSSLSPAPAVATGASSDGCHPALANVVANLDTDGSHFSITHIDRDLHQLAGAVDKFLDIVKETSDEVPPGLSAIGLLNHLGLAGINAMGRSSKESDGAWHNRAFLQTDGDRAGLLSLMGGDGSEWRAAGFAPAGADLVIEIETNLKIIRETMAKVSRAVGNEVEQGYTEAMREKIAGSVLSVGDLLGKTDLRATLVLSMDRAKRWEAAEGIELPTMDLALRIERGMWLWKQYGKQLEAMGEVSQADGLKFVKAPEEIPTPMGGLRPVVALDEAKDIIWFSLTSKFLDTCLSPSGTLSESDDFSKATAGFPEKGNAMIYLSQDLCSEMAEQVKRAEKLIPEQGEAALGYKAVTGVLGISSQAPSRGYAWCVSNMKDGILAVGNSPFPDKGYSMTGIIVPIAAISGMTAPMVVRQRSKADQTMIMSNARQLGLALLEYETVNGRYPADLQELVSEGIIDAEIFRRISVCGIDGAEQPLVYISGVSTTDPTAILILSPAPIDGKHVCLRVDNSVGVITESEFAEIMEAQNANR